MLPFAIRSNVEGGEKRSRDCWELGKNKTKTIGGPSTSQGGGVPRRRSLSRLRCLHVGSAKKCHQGGGLSKLSYLRVTKDAGTRRQGAIQNLISEKRTKACLQQSASTAEGSKTRTSASGVRGRGVKKRKNGVRTTVKQSRTCRHRLDRGGGTCAPVLRPVKDLQLSSASIIRNERGGRLFVKKCGDNDGSFLNRIRLCWV